MKTKNLVLIAAIVILVASLGCLNKTEKISLETNAQISENITDSVQQGNKLPRSIGQYYQKDPVYLFKMWELGGAMMGIVTDFQQKDMDNIKKSFGAFSKSYIDSSSMVPEWTEYYDLAALNKLEMALESGIPGDIFSSLDEVGKTCINCHKDTKAMVWAKYHWKDFKTINMSTINPEEPELPWAIAKMKYMAPSFDGTIVNIQERQQKNATDSWNQFNAMFFNMEKACAGCHKESPRSYVSQDVKSLISTAGKQINEGDMDLAEKTMKQIGDSCYKCHIIHEPAQRIRESLDEQ